MGIFAENFFQLCIGNREWQHDGVPFLGDHAPDIDSVDDESGGSTIINMFANHLELLHSRHLWTLQVCGAQVDFHHTFNEELLPIWSFTICF